MHRLLKLIAFALTSAASLLAAEPPDLTVRLMAPLELADFTVVGAITPAGALRLMKEKIKLGSPEADAYEFLMVPADPKSQDPKAAEQRIRVENVEQYLAAMKRGAYPMTTFDIAMDGWAVRPTAVLKFVSRCVESKRTHLPERLLPALPVEILGLVGSAAGKALKADTAKGKTLGDYQQAGKLKQFQHKMHELHFEDATQQFVLTELARGDLDRDGNEDALVAVAWAYRGGSGNGFHTVVIRRADPKARLAVDPMPLP